MSAAHDWSGFDKAFPNGAQSSGGVVNAPPTTNGPVSRASGYLDPQSPVVQNMLDRASGVATPAPGQSFTSPYGSGSVAYAPKGSTPTAATPVFDTSYDKSAAGRQVQTGVARTADPNEYNPDTARANLFAAYPEVFKAGTPQNAAFVAHAKEFGLQSAHQNASSILDPIYQANAAVNRPAQADLTVNGKTVPGAAATNLNAAMVRNDIPNLSGGDLAASQRSTQQNLADMQKTFDPASPVGKTVDFVQNFPDRVGSMLGNAGRSVLGAVGVQPGAVDKMYGWIGNQTDKATSALANAFNGDSSQQSQTPQGPLARLNGYSGQGGDY